MCHSLKDRISVLSGFLGRNGLRDYFHIQLMMVFVFVLLFHQLNCSFEFLREIADATFAISHPLRISLPRFSRQHSQD